MDDRLHAARRLVTANERNAIAVVTEKGPLEFPTGPVLIGKRLCTTNSDTARRDNFPATPGEGPKINCVS